jgi:hypothetical protein
MNIEDYVKREGGLARVKEAVRNATQDQSSVESFSGDDYQPHSEVDNAMKHLGDKYDYVSRRPSLEELKDWFDANSGDDTCLIRVAQLVVGRLYEEIDTYGGAKPIMREWLADYRKDVERLLGDNGGQ